jgi:hypothetical protein
MKKMFVLLALGREDDDTVVFVSEDKETLEQYIADRDSEHDYTVKYHIYWKSMFENYPKFTQSNPKKHCTSSARTMIGWSKGSTPEQIKYDKDYDDWLRAAELHADKETAVHFNLDPNVDYAFGREIFERQKYRIISVGVLERRI